jgi:hypothetical protein
VWNTIQALQKNGTARLKIPVKIVTSTNETTRAAIAEENQKDNKADLLVVLKAPLATAPSPGTTSEVIGVIVDYQPNPFLFVMRDGEVAGAK